MTRTLSTPDLILKPLTKATQRNVDWLNDQEVVQFSENRHHKHSIPSCSRYIASFVGDSHIWAIVLADTGRHIGNITSTYDVNNKVSEIAILVGDKDEWGKGYGSQAWNTVSDWVLGSGQVRKLEAGCAANNAGMRKILNRDKRWILEGERKNRLLFTGHPVSVLMYGRFI